MAIATTSSMWRGWTSTDSATSTALEPELPSRITNIRQGIGNSGDSSMQVFFRMINGSEHLPKRAVMFRGLGSQGAWVSLFDLRVFADPGSWVPAAVLFLGKEHGG